MPDEPGRIVVSGLTKMFGTVRAVDNLSFAVEPGTVTGFLGPNGAGKTTTLRCVLGLVTPTAGTATISGLRYSDLPGIPQTLIGVVVCLAVFTVVGVGIGALVRNQIAAVVGTLVYILIIEAFVSVLPTIRDYYRFFPGGASAGLTNNYQPDVEFLAAWQAGLLLTAYGVVFAALGTALTVRRDVT